MRRPLQDLGAHTTQKTIQERREARRPFPRKEMQNGCKFYRDRSAALFRVAAAIAPSRAAELAWLDLSFRRGLIPLTARLSAAATIKSVGGATTPATVELYQQ